MITLLRLFLGKQPAENSAFSSRVDCGERATGAIFKKVAFSKIIKIKIKLGGKRF